MAKNLSGSTLEKQKRDLILKTMAFGVKKTKETQGLIHSCSRLTAKNNTLDQLISYLIGIGFNEKLNLITIDLVRDFLQTKVEDGNCNKTLAEHISKISSSWTALNSLGYVTDIYPEDFDDLREEFKHAGHETFHRNRAFADPEKIIEGLYGLFLDSGIIAELQYTCGYRVHEAFQVRPDIIEFQGDDLYIKEGAIQGKGGFALHKKKISAELGQKIMMQFAFIGRWKITSAIYNSRIKHVAGKGYSSHCFRYNYAQNLFTKLKNEGMSDEDAKFDVSEAMGHHRPEITNHYLSNER